MSSSSGMYKSYAEVLSLTQSVKDDLAAVLDPESGYAPRLRAVCREHIEELADRADSRGHRNVRDEIEVLQLEENTWGLLQTLMPARKTDPPPSPSPPHLLHTNPYLPPSALAQAIIRTSRLLGELLVVREWLQDTAPLPQRPEVGAGYWRVTRLVLVQGLRTGGGGGKDKGGAQGGGGGEGKEGLVKQMDPDAVNRGEGGLVAEDASYEKSLLQALYGYVRAGRLEEAVEVCRRAQQPWRAASLRGSLFFRWKAISTEPRDEEGSDEEEEEEEEPEGYSGNPNRTLWKATCTRAALSPALSDHERLLYAALAPSSQVLSILKNACRTWEDHLWVETSVMCEERASKELARLARWSFWEGGVEGVERGGVEGEEGGEEGEGRDEEGEGEGTQGEREEEEAERERRQREEEEWEGEVRGALEALKGVSVVDGPPADHAFHYSQLHIILDQTDALLNTFARGLRDGAYMPDTFEYDAMCRFFAHLCLFLQMIDVATPLESTRAILEAYIQVLEDAGERDLIALYAAALGTNAVQRYAAFLVSLGLSADFDERRAALTRASEHGLDMVLVAKTAAERSVTEAFNMLPPLKDPLPSIIKLQPPPNEAEMFLLRSIEWTTFLPETYQMALEQATVILRYFLGAGRIQAAQSLLALLPPELASLDTPEEIATEYLHYRQFFVIWEAIEEVTAWGAQEGVVGREREGAQGPGGREARAAWVVEYRDLIDRAYDQIMRLLTTEWLIADEFDTRPMALKRAQDLARIRQIFVPELIIKLHFMLFSSRKVIPENLKRTLDLTNVVADARYNLYLDFSPSSPSSSPSYPSSYPSSSPPSSSTTKAKGGRTLAEYLGAVRQAVLAGLEGGGADPWRVVSG